MINRPLFDCQKQLKSWRSTVLTLSMALWILIKPLHPRIVSNFPSILNLIIKSIKHWQGFSHILYWVQVRSSAPKLNRMEKWSARQPRSKRSSSWKVLCLPTVNSSSSFPTQFFTNHLPQLVAAILLAQLMGVRPHSALILWSRRTSMVALSPHFDLQALILIGPVTLWHLR